jgi:hypothetical protein
MMDRTRLSAGTRDNGAVRRPAARMQRALRAIGWLTGTVAALLMGVGFSWTLGRAARAPQGQPLPPAEARVVAQQQALSGRLAADQQTINQVSSQIQALTAGASSAPAPATAMPSVHGMTRAS